MALNYYNFVQRFAKLTDTLKADVDPSILVPAAIDYAEQRIYRELDPLREQITDSTTFVSSGVRTVAISTAVGSYITVDQVSVVSTGSSTRYPLVAVSRPFLDASYPDNTTVTGQPSLFAIVSDTQLLLGPAPDKGYGIEFIGVQRPTALSSTNTTTYLTQYCPDLLVACAVVYAFSYVRDFGGQTYNPTLAQSWEMQYQQLFKSAQAEIMRAKHQGQTWAPYSVSPEATPPRA